MPVEALLSVLTGGVVLGSLYALMATGLAVVWTTLGIFNFAHGAFIAVGAYIAWQISSVDAGGAGFAVGMVGAVVGLFFLGALSNFVLVRPFERKPNLVLLSVVTTLAGATILKNLLIVGWGARPKQIAPMAEGDLHIGEVAISQNEAVIIVLVLFILAMVGFFLRRTRTGRAMRAVAQNREAAQLMGLDVPKLYGLAFGLSAALAGLAGVFIGSIRFINPSMGADPLLKALIVVIFGGVARFTSPIYAAYIVGMVEALAIYFVGLYWAPAVLFLLMIVVLVIKPEGLFEKHERSV